jgi:hypothetical protein
VNRRRTAAFGFALGAALASVADVARAQRQPELRIEGGFAYITQRGFSSEDAALLAILWRPTSEKLGFVTSANLTYAQDSLAAAQGVAAVDVPWKWNSHLRTEAGVAGASFSLRREGRGGNGNTFVRQHVVASNYGAWFGAGAGATNRDGVFARSYTADIGLWQRWGPLYLSGVVTRLQSADWPLLLASGVTREPDDEVFNLRDAQLTAQLRYGPHDIALTYTARAGTADTEASFDALTWTGTLQIADRVALVGSAGRQLADPLRGLPQAEVITASVRVSLGPKPLPVLERSMIARASIEPQPLGGGVLEVRVFASEALEIIIAGDFSDWRPIRMERADGVWVARVRLPTGKYRVAVQVNGGEWRAPRNLARVRDDFGGEAGLVVIP